jgi:cysteinyl-tRNA synthetase
MPIKIYNTLTRKKEAFQPREDDLVRMYVCGPTVYDQAHVGHAMSSIVFDIIHRYLEFRGYHVRHVMNYTDVDDKVILRAQELKVDPIQLAEKYIREYHEHLQSLNILPADEYPRVSQEIQSIIKMVEGLIEKGHAYQADGDVYFRVSTDEDYGKLSRRRLEDMQAGLRLDVDTRKHDPADFALWKSAKPGEPAWESPWGPGRPGWHIECSAMSLQHLGEQIDIHGGGNDLIFPHHENEIAQTECYTGKSFATYWVHNGMAQLGGEAMSKSTGNVLTIDEFLSEHEPEVLRMIVLNSNYRSPLTFNPQVIDQAKSALERLRSSLKPGVAEASGNQTSEEALTAQVETARQKFIQAMDDDFNTAAALGELFEFVRAINLARDQGVSDPVLKSAQTVLIELGGVLGLTLGKKVSTDTEAGPFIDLLIQVRQELRAARQFALADLVRDRLLELGVALEDGKDGTSWRPR